MQHPRRMKSNPKAHDWRDLHLWSEKRNEIARIIDPGAFTERGTAARCAEARQKARKILGLVAAPAPGGETRDKIAAVIGKQYFADFEDDACSCAQCEAERESCRKLADQVIALAQSASPSLGRQSGDCIIPEEDIVRLIKDHFSASQQKHFLVSVGLNEEKPKMSVRNFADAVLALYSSASPEAAITPTEGPNE